MISDYPKTNLAAANRGAKVEYYPGPDFKKFDIHIREIASINKVCVYRYPDKISQNLVALGCKAQVRCNDIYSNRPIYYFTYLLYRMTSSFENDVINITEPLLFTCKLYTDKHNYESKMN